jgi:hypothetical protein
MFVKGLLSPAFLACLLALSPSALKAEPAATEAAEYGAVRGYIINRDWDPISGALVVVGGTQRFATTNADGYYIIKPVPAGEYTVRASKVDYGEVEKENVLVVAEHNTVANFVLGVHPALLLRTKGLIEGHVVDVTGCPLKDAVVSTLEEGTGVKTDAEGGFSLGPLAPGFYSVRAGSPGYLYQTVRILVVGGEVTSAQFVLWADADSFKSGL